MELKNFFNSLLRLKARYYLGISVFLVMGLGAVIIANVDNNSPKVLRSLAAFLSPNDHLARLTREDRTWLANEYLRRRCTNSSGVETSCGFQDGWADGDASYDWDPYMNKIPRGTQVVVDIHCDPHSRKFKTNVFFPNICLPKNGGQECGQFYFKNPYDEDGIGPFSTQPSNWLTSPGKFSRQHMTNLTGRDSNQMDMKQAKASLKGGSLVVSEHHIVSERKSWEGAQMTNVIWLKGDYAIHGSDHVTGHPESMGCIRLQPKKALGLYNLARRVGTKNMHYEFGGYGPTDPSTGQPACAHPGPPVPQHVADAEYQQQVNESRESRKHLGNHLSDFFASIGRAFTGDGSGERRGQLPQGSER